MPYDEQLAARIRRAMARRKGVTEMKMFGGIAFLLNGNMCCGALNSDLVLRLAPEVGQLALEEEPHTRPMDFTGRPMKGWIYVAAEGCQSDDDLRRWIRRAAAFASSLPAKK